MTFISLLGCGTAYSSLAALDDAELHTKIPNRASRSNKARTVWRCLQHDGSSTIFVTLTRELCARFRFQLDTCMIN
jgi:hypothetical protein